MPGVGVGLGPRKAAPGRGLVGDRQVAGDGHRIGRHPGPAGDLEAARRVGAELAGQAVADPGVEQAGRGQRDVGGAGDRDDGVGGRGGSAGADRVGGSHREPVARAIRQPRHDRRGCAGRGGRATAGRRGHRVAGDGAAAVIRRSVPGNCRGAIGGDGSDIRRRIGRRGRRTRAEGVGLNIECAPGLVRRGHRDMAAVHADEQVVEDLCVGSRQRRIARAAMADGIRIKGAARVDTPEVFAAAAGHVADHGRARDHRPVALVEVSVAVEHEAHVVRRQQSLEGGRPLEIRVAWLTVVIGVERVVEEREFQGHRCIRGEVVGQPRLLLTTWHTAGHRAIPVAGEIAEVLAVGVRPGGLEDVEAGVAPCERVPRARVGRGAAGARRAAIAFRAVRTA